MTQRMTLVIESYANKLYCSLQQVRTAADLLIKIRLAPTIWQ